MDSQFSSAVPQWDSRSRDSVLPFPLERGVRCIPRGRRQADVPWEWELRGSLRHPRPEHVLPDVQGRRRGGRGSVMFLAG